jgi:hypothetical protein
MLQPTRPGQQTGAAVAAALEKGERTQTPAAQAGGRAPRGQTATEEQLDMTSLRVRHIAVCGMMACFCCKLKPMSLPKHPRHRT